MIFKFDQGGWIPPLASYTPVIVSDKRVPTTTQETSSKSDGGLSNKEIFSMIKDRFKGLPSDQQAVMAKLAPIFAPTNIWDPSTTASTESKYLQALNAIANLDFNKEQYDTVYKHLQEKGGLNEVAIDGGRVYVTDGKNYKLMAPQEAKQSGLYIVTNANLLYERANNVALAMNNDILRVANNGTSQEQITDYIQKCIQNLGVTNTNETLYANVTAGQMLKGLSDFQKAVQESGNYDASLHDLYSGKYMTKDSVEQAKQALNYIYSTLPMNMKTLLKMQTNNGTDAEAREMIGALIISKTSPEKEFTLKKEALASDKEEKENSITKMALDPVSMLQAGYGQKNQFTIQTGAGVNNGIEVPTVSMPITQGGKALGVTTLANVASSDYAGYLDFRNAFMGDVQIPQAGMQNIAVDATALYTAYLPVDIQYFNKTNKIRPDIAMLGRYKQAQEEIKQSGTKDPAKINAIYQQHNLPIMYSPNGDVLTNYTKFAVINGTALDNAFNEDADFADYLTETSDKNQIANTLSILNKDRGEKNKVEYDEKSMFDSIFGTKYTHVYQGTIFMPINDDYFTAVAATGKYPTAKQAETIEAKQQAIARTKGYVNPGQL